MKAEGEGKLSDARDLFARAWQVATDDYYASVAAHFVARQAETLEGKLEWNLRALSHADAVGDGSVASFYPSLYLNVGYAREQLGEFDEAARCYDMAAERLDDQLPGPLGDLVRSGIDAGRRRIAEKLEGFLRTETSLDSRDEVDV